MWSGSDLICSPCPAGAWCANNVLTECPAGTASDTLLASTPTECQSCQPGWYQPGAKSSVCLPCPAGSVCPGTGRTVPGDQCPPGEWAPTQATTCTLCPAGTASDTAGVAVCPLCPDGTAQPQVGQTSCSACAVGEQPSADKAQCVNCLPGTSSSSGVSCQACPLGHHAPASRTCAKSCCLGAASGCVREAACFTVKLTPGIVCLRQAHRHVWSVHQARMPISPGYQSAASALSTPSVPCPRRQARAFARNARRPR